jgi:hypothetical protein
MARLLPVALALFLAGCVEKLDFGTVLVGASNSRTVYWKNTSGAPENLDFSAITGPASGDFFPEGASQTNLQPHESASITFTFRPTSAGAREASCRVVAKIENNMPYAANTVEVEYHLRGMGKLVNAGAAP